MKSLTQDQIQELDRWSLNCQPRLTVCWTKPSTSLEIGKHALNYVPKAAGGRGQKGGLSEYAEKLGKDKGNVSRWKNAAEVANRCTDTTVLLDKAQHLATIHSLPELY